MSRNVLKALAMTPHPEFPQLAKAIQRCLALAVPWSGTVYRIASTRYANANDLQTGVGSRGAGGRWNPLGSFATVYASLDIHTAADEVLASHR